MLLETEVLEVRYGSIAAVRGVSLSVAPGEIVGLIGANGAGKSSILNAIAGAVRVAGGRVLFRDEDITRQPAHAKATRGLSLVPEGRRIFGTLTVSENLRLAAHRTRDRQRIANLVRTVLASFPGLERHLEAPAGRLSGGEQQQLAIGRALMTEPELLLLDEPSLGLAPHLTDTIFDSFETLRASGVSMLLVEQNARRTVEVADRTYVLRNGVITNQGHGAKLLESSDIRDLYAGLADD